MNSKVENKDKKTRKIFNSKNKDDFMIIEDTTLGILDETAPIYKKRTFPIETIKKDMSYFNFISNHESRKLTLAVTGSKKSGKTSFIKYLTNYCIYKKSTKSTKENNISYEKEKDTTLHCDITCLFVSLKTGESKILNLIDTPSHYDFLPETMNGIYQSDAVIFITDCSGIITTQDELILKILKKLKKKAFVIFNMKVGLKNENIVIKIREMKKKIKSIYSDVTFFASSQKNNVFTFYDDLDVNIEWDSIILQIFYFFDKKFFKISDLISCNRYSVFNYPSQNNIIRFKYISGELYALVIFKEKLEKNKYYKYGNVNILIEEIIVPFMNCLVSVPYINSNIAALVKFKNTDEIFEIFKIKIQNFKKFISMECVHALESKIKINKSLGLYSKYGGLEVVTETKNLKELVQALKKVNFIYPQMDFKNSILTGPGCMYNEGVLYDLKILFNVDFNVIAVLPTFLEFIENDLVKSTEITNSQYQIQTTQKIKNDEESDISRQITQEGPLLGKQIINSSISFYNKNSGNLIEKGKLREHAHTILLKHIKLIEPVGIYEIIYDDKFDSFVTQVIKTYSGHTYKKIKIPYTNINIIYSSIPMSRSLSFDSYIISYTCGSAFINSFILYWKTINKKDEEISIVSCLRNIYKRYM